MFPKLLSVHTAGNYQLQLQFDDGTKGIADVSHLAGRGIFKQWDENELFQKVKIDPETNALVWNDMLDLDPDNLYLRVVINDRLNGDEWADKSVSTGELPSA